ncbi:MAG: lysine methyltransferase [Desulfuromonas sp. SDB]|nr:MAG: lysine methyltransferase [Desulfuromonas sp. SDB]
MIHPDTEIQFINHEIGYGVVATKLIPKGTITWVMDQLDRVFTVEDISRLDPIYYEILDKYSFLDNQGNFVLCWDNGRFVNHSFNPSCITTAYNYELAVKDIYPGDQLTDDYGFLNVPKPFKCIKEKGTSRKEVLPDDLLRLHRRWDRKLKSAYRSFNKVKQPLLKFLDPEIFQLTQKVVQGEKEMDSIINCYYRGPRFDLEELSSAKNI